MSARPNCSDIILSAVASQITDVSIVYSSVCSGADEKKHIYHLTVVTLVKYEIIQRSNQVFCKVEIPLTGNVQTQL